MNEKLNGFSVCGVSVIQAGSISELSHAGGKYHLTCTAPSAADLPRFIELRDKIEKYKDNFWWSRKVRLLKAELEAIPQKVMWDDVIDNVVTTVGGNNMLDNHLSGSAYTAAWYIGLISATGYTSAPVIADTAASHAGWAEDQNYSQATRIAAAFSAASAKSKALSAALNFSINATTTIKGAFLISNSTKGGTTGILYSAGLATGGDRAVINGDTLAVSYTASV